MHRSIPVLAISAALGITAVGTPGHASAQDSGTLKKVRDAGKIVMGVRDSSAPLSYTLGGGQYTGYHVELCQRIIERMKAELKAPGVKTEYTLVTSQNRIPLVENGTVDLECGSTTNNAARQKQVAFGLTTYVTEVRMAVKANSGITSIGQLNGKQRGHHHRHDLGAARCASTSAGPASTSRKSTARTTPTRSCCSNPGRADAFVMDDNILAGNIANAKNPNDYTIVGEVLSVEPIAVMFRKDDAAFKRWSMTPSAA